MLIWKTGAYFYRFFPKYLENNLKQVVAVNFLAVSPYFKHPVRQHFTGIGLSGMFDVNLTSTSPAGPRYHSAGWSSASPHGPAQHSGDLAPPVAWSVSWRVARSWPVLRVSSTSCSAQQKLTSGTKRAGRGPLLFRIAVKMSMAVSPGTRSSC